MGHIKARWVRRLFVIICVLSLSASLAACKAASKPLPTPAPASPAASGMAGAPSGKGEQLPDFTSVVAKVKPSVVAINTEMISYDIFNNPYSQAAAGSGWVLDDNGLVVTNEHVIKDAKIIVVILPDGKTIPADLVGSDELSDLAVLRVKAQGLKKIEIGDSSNVQIGEWVLSIGNSLGLGITAKEGIVSRTGVTLQSSTQEMIDKLVETSAAINPGNSGGPLVNMNAEIIGITSQKIATSGVEGMGYAISISQALPVIQELIQKGFIVRPWIGIIAYDLNAFLKQMLNLQVDSGALIAQLPTDSPAYKAGMREGDVIVSFDGKTITSAQDLIAAVISSKIGDDAEITYWSKGVKNTVHVKIIATPAPGK